jgi:hypothetical protein
MPTTDAYLYGHATSDYRLRFSLTTGRNLVVMDVDEDGDDTLDPPPPDTAGAVTVPEFDNVTALGPLAGSVSGGGWTCPFAIAKYRADFAQYYGVEIQGTAYYSNSPLAPVTLFRGYMQDVNPARTAGSDITRFVAATSDRFLRDNALSYGIDWYLSADHIAPIAVADAIRHMLEAHTNLSPRSNINIGLPATDLYALATSAGDLAGIIKGIAGAVLPDAWFFFRRDDTAVATAHPNVAGESLRREEALRERHDARRPWGRYRVVDNSPWRGPGRHSCGCGPTVVYVYVSGHDVSGGAGGEHAVLSVDLATLAWTRLSTSPVVGTYARRPLRPCRRASAASPAC